MSHHPSFSPKQGLQLSLHVVMHIILDLRAWLRPYHAFPHAYILSISNKTLRRWKTEISSPFWGGASRQAPYSSYCLSGCDGLTRASSGVLNSSLLAELPPPTQSQQIRYCCKGFFFLTEKEAKGTCTAMQKAVWYLSFVNGMRGLTAYPKRTVCLRRLLSFQN